MLNQLTVLNNGHPIDTEHLNSSIDTNLLNLETLWTTKQIEDPNLLILQQSVGIAFQKLRLQKAKGLPQISLGINQQQIPNSSHFGIYSGITIPLWANKHKVDAKYYNVIHRQSISQVTKSKYYSKLKESFESYQLLLKKYLKYQSVLGEIDTELLLLESYKLGEISFTTYYLEIQFYRQSFDTYLEMENQLLKTQANLLKHQLLFKHRVY